MRFASPADPRTRGPIYIVDQCWLVRNWQRATAIELNIQPGLAEYFIDQVSSSCCHGSRSGRVAIPSVVSG
jgi:hypothetical protein